MPNENTLVQDKNWVQHRRSYVHSLRFSGHDVRLYPTKVVFCKRFADETDMLALGRVTVYTNSEERMIGFEFHSNQNDRNSYSLKSNNSVYFNMSLLFRKHRFLADLMSMPGLKTFKLTLRTIEIPVESGPVLSKSIYVAEISQTTEQESNGTT